MLDKDNPITELPDAVIEFKIPKSDTPRKNFLSPSNFCLINIVILSRWQKSDQLLSSKKGISLLQMAFLGTSNIATRRIAGRPWGRRLSIRTHDARQNSVIVLGLSQSHYDNQPANMTYTKSRPGTATCQAPHASTIKGDTSTSHHLTSPHRA